MTVNKEHIELWCQALESDGYKQCQGHLKKWGLAESTMHCAEGVAMEVAQAHGVRIYRTEWGNGAMPRRVRGWYGFPPDSCGTYVKLDAGTVTVVGANDRLKMSFWEIAQGLRAMYLKDE